MRNIVLIGFMGTGKTSTGKLLASRLGYAFIDTDSRIEAINKISISEMFAVHGEKYFREKEAELIKKVSRCHHAVISTGGGVILNPANMVALQKNGIVISLQASVDAILERTSRRNVRPLLEQKDRREIVTMLLNQRLERYRQAKFVIDTTDLSPMQVTDEIIDFIRRDVGSTCVR